MNEGYFVVAVYFVIIAILAKVSGGSYSIYFILMSIILVFLGIYAG